MGQKWNIRRRLCDKCLTEYEANALGIKEHAEKCGGVPASNNSSDAQP